MTEEQNMNESPPAPKRRGRPPKSRPIEREPMRQAQQAGWKMPANPNWETMEPTALDTPDRYRIAESLIPEGLSFQWVTSLVYGKDFTSHRQTFEQRGWTPVHQDYFDGRFDGMFMPKGREGEIALDGMVLMMRPAELTEKARRRDAAMAREAVAIKEQSLRGGDINTTLDSHHPTALNTNRINKSVERITIPED